MPPVGRRGIRAQPLRQYIEAKLTHFEDLAIRFESDKGAAFLRFTDFFQRRLRIAAPITLLIDFAVALDLDFQGFCQSVNDGDSHSVKTARNFVRSFIELAPRVELCKHNLGGGDSFRLMNVHGNTAAIVDYCDAIIDVNRYVNLVAITGQSLVNGVIHNFIYEVMKSPFTGVTDVHSWALSDRFQPF